MKYVRRAFGCKINPRTFKSSFEALPELEKERLQRIAWRMWVTLKLRYELTTYSHPFVGYNEEFRLGWIEWPSLEIYLLFTCIDTLSGQPRHRAFSQWINENPPAGRLDLDDIVNLYDRYSDEHGVTRNLRTTFNNLPETIKNWLSENVVIQRANRDFNPDTSNQELDALTRRLFDYFYVVRRNQFTHGSKTLQTSIAQHIEANNDTWFIPMSGWGFVPDTSSPNRTWNLYLRTGIDEATILRTIIHAVTLQKLRIEVTRDIIDAQIETHARRSTFYGFLNEISSNASSIRWWQDFDEHGKGTIHTYLAHAGIPLLSTEWSTRARDHFKIDLPLENGLRGLTVQYIKIVERLNSAISDFNQSKLPTDDWIERLSRIKSFFTNLADDQAYEFVMRMPHRTETTNVWIVIRDPCYS